MMNRVLFLAVFAVPGVFALTLVRDGVPAFSVVVAEGATEVERTAGRELQRYLSGAIGRDVDLVGESDWQGGHAVYVGPTGVALRHGIRPEQLGPEEWVVRVADGDLLLAGGRPRGTLYAVYRFLEDVVGVHWWNPWAEHVPAVSALRVADTLALRGRPAFEYRDIYTIYGRDGGRFAVRNRLNRQGDADILPDYGGCRDYGPPYHVHTFNMYVPPATYGDTHPEWFSLIDGERRTERSQLCLTNPELRAFLLERLRAYITDSWARADAAGLPRPRVFEVSQNDWRGACECDRCQAIVTAEGSQAGPVLDTVNDLADAIRADYPGVFVSTLAYSYTEELPRTIRPRGNVIVRLCDTRSNQTRPITHPDNRYFHDRLLEWSEGTENLRIWDYAVTYSKPHGMPMPSVHTYQRDYRFYRAHNVTGVFTELEFPVLADMRDLKVWTMCKLLEDPDRGYDELLDTFTTGFYGAAGPLVKAYLQSLEAAAEAKPAFLAMQGALTAYTYLTADFCIEAQGIFDRAEEAVHDDPTLVQRVRHARLPIDRATVYTFPRLTGEWLASGRELDAMPLDRDVIASRGRQRWVTEIERRLPERQRASAVAAMDAELAKYTALPAFLPLPERFRGMPPGSVFDFAAPASRNWQDIVLTVADVEAESGVTNRLQFPPAVAAERHSVDTYLLPMPWGVYDNRARKGVMSSTIPADAVPGPGYHWYRLGTCAIGPGCYVYFFWSWIIQVDVGSVFLESRPDRRFEIWARVKFEGPAFPHGRPGDRDAICVERVVLVAADARRAD